MVQSPGGGEVPTKNSMVYLSGLISNGRTCKTNRHGKIRPQVLAEDLGTRGFTFKRKLLQEQRLRSAFQEKIRRKSDIHVWAATVRRYLSTRRGCRNVLSPRDEFDMCVTQRTQRVATRAAHHGTHDMYCVSGEHASLYNLNTMWLSAAACRRINGFRARCFRQILHTPIAFISHVSNEIVLRMAGPQPLSKNFFWQSLSYFGRIAHTPDEAAVRQVAFDPGTLKLKTQERGPSQEGASEDQLGTSSATARGDGSRQRTTAARRARG